MRAGRVAGVADAADAGEEIPREVLEGPRMSVWSVLGGLGPHEVLVGPREVMVPVQEMLEPDAAAVAGGAGPREVPV
ncbi:hypothetical protein ACFPOI_39900 [Nonomuraea angiospora]|uniref:Uncharacterized protein n=1 Tax=Nonomuraea angiospora TaxID=46172 RepID=A0ABR9M5P3_9ACTN|nr:hypothetical protein [Nonomuraea angiospora]MBE1587847.1 hypothetical protein [Nonomuraea angiospora]